MDNKASFRGVAQGCADEIAAVVTRLMEHSAVRLPHDGAGASAPLPDHEEVGKIIALGGRLIFPGFFGKSGVSPANLSYYTGIAVEEMFNSLRSQIAAGLAFGESPANSLCDRAEALALEFLQSLPDMRRVLLADAWATYFGDPAATSADEVIFCYPGLRATVNYRIAHRLAMLGVPVIPRMITEQAHRDTGIDIHPGAVIGERFVIDHGTGVVIGATSIIGDNVKIYQGVTLGARSFDRDEFDNPVKGVPRHPVIGNNVVIYSNTTVLGRINVGDGAVIGGNLWVTEDVAPGEKLVQARHDNILRFKQ